MRSRLRMGLALATLFLIASSNPSPASEAQKLPRLGPHTFVPNSFGREPFIQSYIRSGTGAGGTNSVTVPAVVLPDSTELLNLDTSIAVMALDFELQQAIKSWVAVRASFQIFGRMGTSTESLLSEGVTGAASFELGWLFKLLHSERDALSLDVYLERNRGSFINLLDWLDRIVDDDGLEPDNSLVVSGESLRSVGGLNFAHGFSPLLGLTAGALVGYGGYLREGGENGFGYRLTTGLSVNLNDTTSIPFGVYLGLGIGDLEDQGREFEGPAQSADLRIDYMGFENFVVGLDLGFSSVSVSGIEDRIQASTVLLTLRYFY